MGQTLTHGIYLPDEGERNCYNGLAANWQLLDCAVGTVAEHTTALAGKAPLVHTHTVSQITDFPTYGTTAGTICEGNDSRLSDARTPVAHTHTKSDVTDLFNSANTWTQTNYFTKDITINSEAAANAQSALSGSKIRQIVFNDSSNSNYFFRFRQYVDATSSRMQFNAQGFDSNNQAYGATFVYRVNSDGSSVLYPGDNNQSLGSSNYQWNNVYSKGYYYNGVAWGLDQNNTWSGSNTFTNGFILRDISWSGKTPPSSRKIVEIPLSNSDTVQSKVMSRVDAYSTETWITTIRNINANTSYDSTLIHTVDNNGNRKLQPLYGDVALGASDSGSRFKTLNGINPGALSLPDINDADPISTNNWVGDNSSSNQYTPTENGWIYFRIEGSNKNITIRYGGAGGDAPSITSESTISHLSVFFPVRSGVTMYIFFNGTMVKAFFYPCLGNV